MGVGRPGQGKEAPQRPSRRPSNSKGEGHEGVRDYRRLPREEGCAADGAWLPLYQMVPEASFEGTVLVDEALPYSKVAQRIKEAMEPTKDSAGAVLDFVYPVPGHPPMRPELGFVDFVSFLASCSFLLL